MLSMFFRKLLLSRQASIEEGEITILSKNFYMQPLYEFIILQEKMKKEFGKKGLEIIYQTGKIGFNDLIRHIEKFATKKEETQILWLNTLKTCGLGDLEIVEIKENSLKAVLQARKNPFAREYMKEYGRQKNPVDYLTAGIIAGFFSRFFEKDVECKEKSCIAKGEKYCNFLVESK